MNVRQVVSALLAGAVFGAGLGVSGLSDPDRVLQFLTISVDWSPALLFVMGAGVIVTFIGYRLVLGRTPVFAERQELPTPRAIDRRLVVGATLFGVGWGFAGFCPGPAITSLASGLLEPAIFLLAMIAGSQLQRVTAK